MFRNATAPKADFDLTDHRPLETMPPELRLAREKYDARMAQVMGTAPGARPSFNPTQRARQSARMPIAPASLTIPVTSFNVDLGNNPLIHPAPRPNYGGLRMETAAMPSEVYADAATLRAMGARRTINPTPQRGMASQINYQPLANERLEVRGGRLTANAVLVPDPQSQRKLLKQESPAENSGRSQRRVLNPTSRMNARGGPSPVRRSYNRGWAGMVGMLPMPSPA
jgi:hypothetical protein